MLAKRPQKKTYGGFQKYWYPQIIHFNRVFHYKPSILGYPYFRKHPYPKLPTIPNHQRQKTSLQKSSSSTPQLRKELFTCEHMPKGWEMMFLFQYFFVGENNNASSLEWTLSMLEQGSFRVSGARLELVKFQRKRWLSLGYQWYQHQKNGEPWLFWDTPMTY